MIQITTKDSFTTLSCLTKSIIFNEWEWDRFKDNLFVLIKENRKQISPTDLKFIDFNLLFYKHIPNYSDLSTPRLDIKHLLETCWWNSTDFHKIIESEKELNS